MNYNYEISAPLAELLASQHEAIAQYKWIESERLGYDIGWTRASDEWFAKHFADWVQAERRLIDEALSMADEPLGATSGGRVRELQPV